jgi:hypothetical protein
MLEDHYIDAKEFTKLCDDIDANFDQVCVGIYRIAQGVISKAGRKWPVEDREDAASYIALNLIKALKSYDPSLTKNAFTYFTCGAYLYLKRFAGERTKKWKRWKRYEQENTPSRNGRA